MLIDLHSHLPMYLPPTPPARWRHLRDPRELREWARARARGGALTVAGWQDNRSSRSGTPRVTVPQLRAAGVDVVFSVLYSAFDEMILSLPWQARELRHRRERKYHWAPAGELAFPRLLRQLEAVERHLAERWPDDVVVVRDAASRRRAISEGKLGVVHCVEGAFHLGSAREAIDDAVAELGRRGVAYVTLGHLFFKGVATVAPCWEAMSPERWESLWPQPRGVGLTERGAIAVAALARERIAIDLTHLSAHALSDVLALLDEVDPERAVPVLASHAAVRFGDHPYNLTSETIESIAARNGVIGLIVAGHLLKDGGQPQPTTFPETTSLLRRHIDRIAAVTGSHRHTALGSDLGGFIRPVHGIETSLGLARLRDALIVAYGDDGAAIAGGNAARLLDARWPVGAA